MPKTTKKQETFQVSGKKLLGKIKDLIKEGNIRRIILKNKNNKILLDLPLTIGVIGIALTPVYTAVAVIAALFAECTISVERE